MLLKNGSLNFLQYSLSVSLIVSFSWIYSKLNQYYFISLAGIFFEDYSAEYLRNMLHHRPKLLSKFRSSVGYNIFIFCQKKRN